MTESDYEAIIKHLTRQLQDAQNTMLDDFAKAALLGVTSVGYKGMSCGDFAADAYELADAMMKERNKHVGNINQSSAAL